MLLRLAYVTVTTAVTRLRLLPLSDRDKDLEILALRHQLLALQRQVPKPEFTGTGRLILSGLLHHLPREKLRRLLLLVRPDRSCGGTAISSSDGTPRPACRKHRGHPPTIRSIRTQVLRLARENSSWGAGKA